MSDLVGNPEDRLPFVMVHMTYIQNHPCMVVGMA